MVIAGPIGNNLKVELSRREIDNTRTLFQDSICLAIAIFTFSSYAALFVPSGIAK